MLVCAGIPLKTQVCLALTVSSLENPRGRSADDRSPARALDILDCIAERGPMTHGEIAAALAIPKSTTTALMESLLASGYVSRTDERRFVLTGRVLKLAAAYLGAGGWQAAITSILADLARATVASAFLVSADGDEIVVLARHLAGEGLTFTLPVGARLPIDITAGGLALLAFRPDRVDDPSLVDIRAGGMAYASGGLVTGVVSFALPIRAPRGQPMLALSVALPVSHESAERTAIITAALNRARDSLEAHTDALPLSGAAPGA